MRILGSIRMLVVYDNEDMSSKDGFDTFQIPVAGGRQPNYFNGLDQTRLGFEITRRTSKSPVFARPETDFAGQFGFRIRHAYGQYQRFLLGQTWSLFSHRSATSRVSAARASPVSLTYYDF